MFNYRDLILKKRKRVIAAVILVTILCVIMIPMVSVNNNVIDYLPDDAPSTIALDVMNEEFSQGVPNARAMVPDVTVAEALEIKAKIAAVEGVDEVQWLDDEVSIEIPVEYLDIDIVENYYVDGNALFTITLNDEKGAAAVTEIDEMLGDSASMSGTKVTSTITGNAMKEDLKKILLVAGPVILIILLLTTNSWFEPLLFMFTIGAAILINMGTNLIFGEISFMTNGVAALLQLAVSMDYAIFILHRFSEAQGEGIPIVEAMTTAVKKSVTSVTASGITTMVGFVALIIMRMKLGPDMGLVMTKAIIISLLCVFILLPALTICCNKAIEKTRHRSFIPNMKGLAKLISRICLPALIVLAVVMVPSVLAVQNNDYIYIDMFNDENSQMGKESAAIKDKFGDYSSLVLMVERGNLAEEQAVVDEIKEIPIVTSVISYVETVGAAIPDAYVPKDTLSKLESDDYSRIVITVDSKLESDESLAAIEQIRAIGEEHYPGGWYLAGEIANTYDMKNSVEEDNTKVSLIAIALVFIILMITFKSITVPIILVLVIESAIWINFGLAYFQGLTVFYIGYMIINAMQLGATIDYAILFTTRYFENRKTMKKRAALENTVSTAAISIITSATILSVCGFILAIMSSNVLLSQVGMFLGRGTLLSLFIVLFALPALLMIFDKVIQKTSLKLKFVPDVKGVKI